MKCHETKEDQAQEEEGEARGIEPRSKLEQSH